MVADALSRKTPQESMLAHLTAQPELQRELMRYGIEVQIQRYQGSLKTLECRPSLLEEVRQK